MLEHLAAYAREHGAIGLHERMGLRRVSPFGAYREDPLSRFYEMEIF